MEASGQQQQLLRQVSGSCAGSAGTIASELAAQLQMAVGVQHFFLG